MTLDRGPDFERTQGITPIEGESLSLCAEHYFAQSEQVPTKVRLAVGRVTGADGVETWRSGGAMIQMVAGDASRGDTEEVWDRSRALFATLVGRPDLATAAADELVFATRVTFALTALLLMSALWLAGRGERAVQDDAARDGCESGER